MKRVVIESPFSPVGAVDGFSPAELMRQNIVYARLCLLDSLSRGEAPIASHLLYTQVYAETPRARAAGIAAGLEWLRMADEQALYVDVGYSAGMCAAADFARLHLIPTTVRTIFSRDANPRLHLAAMRLSDFPALEALSGSL